MTRLFHVTRHADQILAEGFHDSTGDYGFAGTFVFDPRGVLCLWL